MLCDLSPAYGVSYWAVFRFWEMAVFGGSAMPHISAVLSRIPRHAA